MASKFNPIGDIFKKKKKPIPSGPINKPGDIRPVRPGVRELDKPDFRPEDKVKTEADKKVKVFRDKKGRLGGVELPDGRTLLGLNPKEVREIVKKESEDRDLPSGAVEVAEANRQRDVAQAAQVSQEEINAIAKVGSEPSNIPEFQEEQASTGELAKGALGSAGVGIAGGAVGGAILAAPFTGGLSIGALGVGAATGLIGNALRNIINKKSDDAKLNVGVAGLRVKKMRADIDDVIVALNKRMINPSDAADAFESHYSQILSAEAFLQKDIDERATLWDTDAIKKMEDIDQFKRNLPIIRFRFAQAALNPDPNLEFSRETIEEINSELSNG